MLYHINLIKDYRGGERQTELLVRALAALGARQSVVVRRGSMLAASLEGARDFNVIPIGKPFFAHLGVLRKAALVHAHDAQASQFALLAHRLLGKDYLITRRVPNRPKNNPFTRAVYRRARQIVAVSAAVERVLNDYESRARVRVIPDMTARFAVNRDAVARIRNEFPGRFLVGQIGALVMPHKGPQHLIEAAALAREQAREMDFLFIGAGRDEAALKRMAAGMGNVHFMGYRDNVADYLASLDILVFPSLQEGLGSTLLDAMDLGVPIVASRVGGIPEIVRDWHNGLLVSPGDSQGIAAALLELYRQPGARERLVANGRRVVEDFHPDAIARRYLAVYGEIMPAPCA